MTTQAAWIVLPKRCHATSSMLKVNCESIGVDVPADVARVEAILNKG